MTVRATLVVAFLAGIIGTMPTLAHGQGDDEPLLRRRRSVRRVQQAPATGTVGKIKELRWINADTNEPAVIKGTTKVPIQKDEQFADTIDTHDLPNAELTMEAIIDVGSGGPVGSVQFTFNGVTIVENSAPYALCANKGKDFYPCKGLRQEGGTVTAKVFAAKDAKGASSETILTYIRYYTSSPPYGNIHMVNADTDTVIDAYFGNSSVVKLSETPSIGFYLDVWPHRYLWNAESAKFLYDNVQEIVDSDRPLAFPSSNDKDFIGFTPTVGTHTFAATLYSKKNLQGQSTTWGPYTFQVVA